MVKKDRKNKSDNINISEKSQNSLLSLQSVADVLQRSGISDYIEFLSNPKRVIIVNLWAGIARGFGMAVGFTLIGALVVYILQKLAYQHIPYIGSFVSEIVKIVKHQS